MCVRILQAASPWLCPKLIWCESIYKAYVIFILSYTGHSAFTQVCQQARSSLRELLFLHTPGVFEIHLIELKSNEHNRLSTLQKGIDVPKTYGAVDNSLFMECIPGVLINNPVEKLEGGSQGAAKEVLQANRVRSGKYY